MKSLNLLVKLLLVIVVISLSVSAVIAKDAVINKIQPWLIEKVKADKQVEFIVKMKAKADLSLAFKMKDKDSRAQFVYRTLLSAANESQAELRSWLERRGIAYRWFYTTNALLVKGNWDLVYQIAQREDVEEIFGNPEIKNKLPMPKSALLTPSEFLDEILAIEWNVTKLHSPQVWAMGHRGEGVVLGAQDTGYRWTHTAVKNQYRGWDGTVADHDYNWHDSIHSGGGSCGADSPFPCDDYGHGTHTLGTVLGSDFNPGSGQTCASTTTNQVGSAPCARWIGCRNMDVGVGTPARYIECFDFFLAPYPVGGDPSEGDPSKAPDLTTNSWTCPPAEGCAWDSLQDSVNAHYAAGIMFVVAAGNDGSSCGSVNDPGSIYQNSYTIGSTTSSDNMSGFSSRGPADNTSLMKPNAVSPGSNVRSSYYSSDTAYTTMDGTSMATPGAAGVVTLLWSCLPGIKNDIAATVNILNITATRLTAIVEGCGGDYVNGPNNTWGYGLLNAEAACNYCTPPPAPTGLTATAPVNNTIHLAWNTVSGATSYKIYRADATGCPGGTYLYIDTVTAPTTMYDDTTVSGGVTYAFVVRASNLCDSTDSNCAQATATGECIAPPTFAGCTSIVDDEGSNCGLAVNWNPGTSNCPSYPNVTYTIYKSTDPLFIPDVTNQVATCLSGTSWHDSNVNYGTTYYYVCRAEDSKTGGSGPCNGGNIDANLARKNASPHGPPIPGTFNEDWESGTSNWTMTGLWHTTTQSAQACMSEPYPSPVTVAYYGQDSTCNFDTGSTTTGNLDTVNLLQGVTASSNLTFMYVYQGEGSTSYDQAYAYVSPNGTTWTQVWVSGSAAQLAWISSGNLSLSAWAGQSIYIRFSFNSVDGILNTYLGFAVDNIAASNIQVPTSCTTGGGVPGKVLDNFTVTKAGANLSLAWTAPGGTCLTTGYGLYRGTLPISAYNHAGIDCTITGTTTTTAQQSGSNYYLIVPLNASSEGSYGTDSAGTQIPQGTSPCHAQDLTPCN